MKKVLAFDFGASSGRAILATFSDDNLSYEEIHRFSNSPVKINGKLRWDFEKIMKEVEISIEKAGEIDSLAFDTWGVDYGIIDKNGDLKGIPVSYRDPRTENLSQNMPISKYELYEKTGTQIMDINTLFQLSCEELSKGDMILFTPDLLSYSLTNTAVCEKTILSTAQIYDTKNNEISADILEKFNIPSNIFAKIVNSGEFVGEYKGIKVIAVAGHDTQSAVVSIPSTDNDVAFLSCGTWSLIGTELNEPILTKESCDLGFSNEIGANGKINYLKNLTGLFILQECKKYWDENGQKCSYADIDKMLEECVAEVDIIDINHKDFATLGDMPQKITKYCEENNLYVPQNIAEFSLCIYKSLAYQYSKALESMKKITGKDINTLHILGGGANAKLLCELTAKYCKIDVFAGPSEATALGNIVVQLVALGEISDIQKAREIIANNEKIKIYRYNTNPD